MGAIGVQVLVIDEVHNILAGSYKEQRIVLNTLRKVLKPPGDLAGVLRRQRGARGNQRRRSTRSQVRAVHTEPLGSERTVRGIGGFYLRNTPLRHPSVLAPKSLSACFRLRKVSPPASFTWSTISPSRPSKAEARESPTTRSRTGNPNSTLKLPSHDAPDRATSVASHAAAGDRRAPVVMDWSACEILRRHAARNAPPLSSGFPVLVRRRHEFDRTIRSGASRLSFRATRISFAG